MIRSALNENIWGVEEISVDIVRKDFFITVENNFGLVIRCGAETNDDAMNMSLLIRFAIPMKSSVSKVNMNVVEERLPKSGNRIALTNRVYLERQEDFSYDFGQIV